MDRGAYESGASHSDLTSVKVKVVVSRGKNPSASHSDPGMNVQVAPLSARRTVARCVATR